MSFAGWRSEPWLPLRAALVAGAAEIAGAVEVQFRQITNGVYAHSDDTAGRTYENEGPNANIGLVVTPAGQHLLCISRGRNHGARTWQSRQAHTWRRPGGGAARCAQGSGGRHGAHAAHTAAKAFNALPASAPYLQLRHGSDLMPGNASWAYIEAERE